MWLKCDLCPNKVNVKKNVHSVFCAKCVSSWYIGIEKNATNNKR